MKKRTSNSDQKGFSLIELMIVVAIVAILGAIAYPSYRDSITDARRTDAQAVLMEAAQYMERFYTENNRYDEDTGGTAVALPSQLAESPRDSGTKYYDLAVQASTRSTYTLRATPKNAQAGDGFLELTNTFVKAWDSNNNGSLADAERTWSQH
ncbi:MAG: type IV pilin protein [Porticoccaceae bacterium]|nr:type IV pilin protein [Porticoccaceae bacterium]